MVKIPDVSLNSSPILGVLSNGRETSRPFAPFSRMQRVDPRQRPLVNVTE
jgi:hypothetical protein